MSCIRVTILCLAISVSLSASVVNAQDVLKLPAPKIRGQVMKALKSRVSFKGFSTRELSDQRLSDLLWAGFGINNPRTGRRTASSAFGANEMDIYVLSSQGIFFYDASAHSLLSVNRKDIREILATQGYAKTAPVHFVYVADYNRANEAYPDQFEKDASTWAMMHTGFIAQNVELYCTVNKMTAIVRLGGNQDTLRKEMRLGDHQQIIVSQAIGYRPDK